MATTIQTKDKNNQPDDATSPFNQHNNINVASAKKANKEFKRHIDAELSQDIPTTKRARIGEVDSQKPVAEGWSKANLDVQLLDDGVQVIDGHAPFQTTLPASNLIQPINGVFQAARDRNKDVMISSSPEIPQKDPGSQIQIHPAENMQPDQGVAAWNQHTLNYAMAKDALGPLADCTTVRCVLLRTPNIIHPHSWEKACDILSKVSPARDDYDIFKRLLYTWYTDRSDTGKDAEDGKLGQAGEYGKEAAAEEPEQEEKSKIEMRANNKFAVVDEDTIFLKNLGDKLQDLWLRLSSSRDEKTRSFSRQVIAEELQEETERILDHLDYKKERNTEAESAAEAVTEAADVAAVGKADNGSFEESSNTANEVAEVEIFLPMQGKRGSKELVPVPVALVTMSNPQTQHSLTHGTATPPTLVEG